MKMTTIASIAGVLFIGAIASHLSVGQQSVEESLSPEKNSDELAQQYIREFRSKGLPTLSAVHALFAKAKEKNTIDAWLEASACANTYANVLDVLKQHHIALSHAASLMEKEHARLSRLKQAAVYEERQNEVLDLRNNALIRVADLYRQEGENVEALAFAMAAVRLSGTKRSSDGEELIRSIIEFK